MPTFSTTNLCDFDWGRTLWRTSPTPLSSPSITARLVNKEKLVRLVLQYPMQNDLKDRHPDESWFLSSLLIVKSVQSNVPKFFYDINDSGGLPSRIDIGRAVQSVYQGALFHGRCNTPCNGQRGLFLGWEFRAAFSFDGFTGRRVWSTWLLRLSACSQTLILAKFQSIYALQHPVAAP